MVLDVVPSDSQTDVQGALEASSSPPWPTEALQVQPEERGAATPLPTSSLSTSALLEGADAAPSPPLPGGAAVVEGAATSHVPPPTVSDAAAFGLVETVHGGGQMAVVCGAATSSLPHTTAVSTPTLGGAGLGPDASVARSAPTPFLLLRRRHRCRFCHLPRQLRLRPRRHPV